MCSKDIITLLQRTVLICHSIYSYSCPLAYYPKNLLSILLFRILGCSGENTAEIHVTGFDIWGHSREEKTLILLSNKHGISNHL